VESEDEMANEPINYKAVLADLEAKKAQIESAISAIKMIAAQAGNTGPGPGSGVGPSAFLKMSIPDATKTLLETTKQKHSTQAVIDALVAGGLPKSKYTTVWGILSRRAKKVGDLINMQGDWALAEWYPNYRKGKTTKEEDIELPDKKGVIKKAKAKRGRPPKSKEAPAATSPSAVAASA
jgi:hypothetical protein